MTRFAGGRLVRVTAIGYASLTLRLAPMMTMSAIIPDWGWVSRDAVTHGMSPTGLAQLAVDQNLWAGNDCRWSSPKLCQRLAIAGAFGEHRLP